MATRKTTSTTTTTKTTTEAPAPPDTSDGQQALDLHALLLGELASAGIKPKVKWAPSHNYCSLYVGKTYIGYVFKQTRSGIRIEPAAHPADLPKTIKGFKKGTRSARFALVGVASQAGAPCARRPALGAFAASRSVRM